MTEQERRERRRLACERHRRKLGRPKRVRPVVERLLEKRTITATGCWEWQGPFTKNGYGVTTAGSRRSKDYVHRISFKEFVGQIPDDLEIDHLCRNRRCFNPQHLELVDRRTNVRRGIGPTILAAKSRERWAAKSEDEKLAQVSRAAHARWSSR